MVTEQHSGNDTARLDELVTRLAELEARTEKMLSFLEARFPKFLVGSEGAFVMFPCAQGTPEEAALVGHYLPRTSNLALEAGEQPAPPWQYLVRRPHRWRRQLYLRGRNLTVRQLIGTIEANGFSLEQAAADFDLPEEAILEAKRYAEENADLLEYEAGFEQHLLAKKGSALALKLYLDDCACSRNLVARLQEAGHSVVIPVEAGLRGASDARHMEYARREALVLLTRNPADFLELHEGNAVHPGILAVYQDNDLTRDMSDLEIVQALGRLEAAYANASLPIAGAFHILNEWRQMASEQGGKAGRKKRKRKD